MSVSVRATVDRERCAGHGACIATCPDVFDLTDTGFAEVTVEEIPAEYVGLVEQAAGQCPERAITVDTE